MFCGKVFQCRETAIGKARLPTVERHVVCDCKQKINKPSAAAHSPFWVSSVHSLDILSWQTVAVGELPAWSCRDWWARHHPHTWAERPSSVWVECGDCHGSVTVPRLAETPEDPSLLSTTDKLQNQRHHLCWLNNLIVNTYSNLLLPIILLCHISSYQLSVADISHQVLDCTAWRRFTIIHNTCWHQLKTFLFQRSFCS